jgi:hypothetical protein
MKLIALESFDYQGTRVAPGVFDGTEAELLSMSQYGRVRPATSTEIQEAEPIQTATAKHPGKETAARR